MTNPVDQLEALSRAMPDAPGEVRIEDGDLVIDNPRARGALTVGMMLELARCVERLRHAGPAIVRVRSVGDGVFCSGGHLGQVRAGLVDPSAGARMCTAMTAVLDGMLCDGPVYVGVLDGAAYGGGAELLTALDLVVAGPMARIAFVQGGLGITTGWGGTRRLALRCTRPAALQILGSSAPIGGADALRMGLIDRAGPDALELADILVDQLQACDPDALRGFKRVLGGQERSGVEASVFAERWGGPAHRARLGLPEP